MGASRRQTLGRRWAQQAAIKCLSDACVRAARQLLNVKVEIGNVVPRQRDRDVPYLQRGVKGLGEVYGWGWDGRGEVMVSWGGVAMEWGGVRMEWGGVRMGPIAVGGG